MNWARLADVAQVAVGLMVILTFVVVLVMAATARDAQAQQVPATSGEIYDWCEAQFPYRDDLQHACRSGAAEQSSR